MYNYNIHIYPRKLIDEFLTYKACPKWDFEQFDEKTTKFKKLQTIKNTNRCSTKIFISLLINWKCLFEN